MRFEETEIKGVFVATPEPHKDERGFFERRFCVKEFEDAGIRASLVQINRSLSKTCGTVRGLHYQVEPMCELKVVQCLKGSVFDVAVDLRKESPTYLKWHGRELNESNGQALCIPHGCAHGYQTLADDSEVLYFTDQFYSPVHERTVHYADKKVGIAWPLPVRAVSVKDSEASPIT